MAAGKTYQVGFVFGAKKAAGFDNTFSGIGSSIKGIGKAIAGLAGAYVGIQTIKDAVGTFATFEQSMANVKAISGATSEEFNQLEAAAMEMGRKTSKTAAESADALGYMALAGWDTQQSIKGLEPILRSSEAFSMDLATASDLVTDSMSAMGIAVDDLGGYLDVVAKAQNSANANGQQMMEAYLGVGGKLKDMNVQLDESAALLGVMANRGIKGSEAGNSLNAIMANLLTPTGQAKNALDALGVSAFDSAGNFKGLENTFVEIIGAMEGLSEQEQRNYKDMIAGKNQSAGFAAILDGLSNEYGELKGQIQGCDGALLETSDIMNDTMEGAFKRLSSATDDLKINLVKSFAGPLTGAINWAAEKIPAATAKIADGFQWIGSKAAPLLSDFGSQVRQLVDSKILPAMEAMMPFAQDLVDGVKERGAQVYNAIGKMAGGDWRGGSADLLGMLGFNSDSVAVIQEYVETLGKAFSSAAGYIKPLFSAIQQGVAKAMPALQGIQNFAVQKILPMAQSVVGFLTEKVFPPIMKFFTENIPRVGAIFNNLWGIIQPILTKFMDKVNMLWQVAQPIISAFVEGVTGLASSIMQTLEGLTGFISGVFSGDWGKAWQGVKDLFGGIFSGLDALIKIPLNAVVGIVNKAIDGINGLKFTVPGWVPGIGGKGFDGLGIPHLPMLASGGIATGPTLAMVGEGRESEAILPLSRLQSLLNSQKLLDIGPIAALMEQLLTTATGGSGGDLVYSPHLVFEGPVDKETVSSALQDDFERFKKWYKQLKQDEERKGLGR